MFDRCISVALEGLGEGDESLFSSALNNARYVYVYLVRLSHVSSLLSLQYIISICLLIQC